MVVWEQTLRQLQLHEQRIVKPLWVCEKWRKLRTRFKCRATHELRKSNDFRNVTNVETKKIKLTLHIFEKLIKNNLTLC